jgi:hypothetical protein
MGFPKQDRTDTLYKQHHTHCHKVLIIDLSGNRAGLEALALEIYERLLKYLALGFNPHLTHHTYNVPRKKQKTNG